MCAFLNAAPNGRCSGQSEGSVTSLIS
jgi:hypothetical protein